MLRQLEDGLADPALSSLYLNHCIDHPKGSVTTVLDYLQEHKEIQKWKRPEDTKLG